MFLMNTQVWKSLYQINEISSISNLSYFAYTSAKVGYFSNLYEHLN